MNTIPAVTPTRRCPGVGRGPPVGYLPVVVEKRERRNDKHDDEHTAYAGRSDPAPAEGMSPVVSTHTTPPAPSQVDTPYM